MTTGDKSEVAPPRGTIARLLMYTVCVIALALVVQVAVFLVWNLGWFLYRIAEVNQRTFDQPWLP